MGGCEHGTERGPKELSAYQLLRLNITDSKIVQSCHDTLDGRELQRRSFCFGHLPAAVAAEAEVSTSIHGNF